MTIAIFEMRGIGGRTRAMTQTHGGSVPLDRAEDASRETRTTAQVPAAEQPDPRRWRALAVTQLVAFMVLLDVSIVNVTLPSIQRDVVMTPTAVQWIVSGYALTLGLTLVPAGRLGDSVGRRRMFLIARPSTRQPGRCSTEPAPGGPRRRHHARRTGLAATAAGHMRAAGPRASDTPGRHT